MQNADEHAEVITRVHDAVTALADAVSELVRLHGATLAELQECRLAADQAGVRPPRSLFSVHRTRHRHS